MLRIIVASGLAWGLFCAVAVADDWTADKLRGQVLQLVDNQWQPLQRGMVVPDSRVIRTLASGRVTFTRGNETVDIAPNTQIQIFDKGGRKPFTTVKQYFGSVSVEAEVRQVQHFEVDTNDLAAVVKGTRFTVTSGRSGSSVAVRRGHVAVEDNHDGSHVTLSVGQVASIDVQKTGGEIVVTGTGKLPVVLGVDANPIIPLSPKELKAAAQLAKKAADAEAKAQKDADKDAKEAAKAADKAAKDAQKDEDKAAKDAAKSGGSGSSVTPGSGSAGGNSGSGNSGGNSNSSSGLSGVGDGGKGKKGKDK